MKRRFLALLTALVMIISLVPAGVLTITAETLEPGQVTPCNEKIQILPGKPISFTVGTPQGEALTQTNGGTALHMDAKAEPEATNDADNKLASGNAISLRTLVTDSSEQYYVFNMQIDKMPIFANGPEGTQGHSSTGLYIHARRPAVSEFKGEAVTENNYPYIHLAIVRMSDGKLGFAVKTAAAEFLDVVPMGIGLGKPFELAIRWLADYSMEVYCNDACLATYGVEDVAQITNNQSVIAEGIRIGYNDFGATADENDGLAIKFDVNSVSLGSTVNLDHTPGINGVCTVCGAAEFLDFSTYEIDLTPYDIASLSNKNSSTVIGVDANQNAAVPVRFTQSTIDSSNVDASCHYLTTTDTPGWTATNGEFFIVQDIKIINMPAFTSFAHGNTRSGTGYYISVPVDVDSGRSGKEVIKLCIYRIDGSEDLYIAAGNGAVCGSRYPLGKKINEKFEMMVHCTSDGSVDIYCDDVFVHTFAKTEFATGASSSNDVFRLGYNSNGADASIAGSETSIEVYGVYTGTKVAHEHRGGTASCTVQAVCEVCGASYGELGQHTPGKNGVCVYCPADGYMDYTRYEISKTDYPLTNLTPANGGTNTTINKDTSPVTITQTAIDESAYSDGVGHYLTSGQIPFDPVTNGFFLIQDIQIDNMPVFASFNNANTRAGTGYYVSCPIDYTSLSSGREIVNLRIYRIDTSNNLYIAAGKGGVCGNRYPLGVTLGQRFTLMAHCKSDGNVDVYCNDVLVHTYAYTDFSLDANGNNSVFRLGYYSNGADASIAGAETDIKVYSVSTGVPVEHVHSGGEAATCTQKSICEVCGMEYGSYAEHTAGSEATCTTLAICSTCGKEYGIYADHTPDAEGNCSVCTVATGYRNLAGISLANKSNGLFSVTDNFTITGSGKFNQILEATESTLSHYSGVLLDAFTTSDAADHVVQTITINKMPVFVGPVSLNAYTGIGFYNNLRRDTYVVDPEAETLSYRCYYTTYGVIPVDAEGNLNLYVSTSENGTTAVWNSISLNRKVGQTFRLLAVWDEDYSISFYCDGQFLQTFENAKVDAANRADCRNALTMGYSSYNAVTDSYGEGEVDFTVKNVIVSHGHIEADDGNCMTGTVCSECGETVKEAQANHVAANDDDNCATPILCANPGCEHVFVEGHALTHVPEVPATDDATGTKEHWYCEADQAYFLDAAGTQKVSETDLILSKRVDVSGDKATVSDEYVSDAITDAETQVDLEVPVSGIVLPTASLNALAQKGLPLAVTTVEGKVTLNADAIAAINSSAAGRAITINVKTGAALEAVQTNELLESYTAVKEVISAEMFADDDEITNFGNTGTVTIEIPFTLDDYGTASEYKLVYVSDDAQTVEVIDNAVFADDVVTATLVHFSDYAIVYTGELPQEPVEGNTTITTNGGSSFATVTGTYVDGLASGDVFSVDVEWDNLSFNYMAADTWDPETHTNTGGGWEENVTGSVTVTNHSNIAVTVTVTKEDIGTEKGLGVNFVGASTDNLDAGTPENVGAADYCVVEFAPKGTLVEGDTDVTLATITVTITKYDPQN